MIIFDYRFLKKLWHRSSLIIVDQYESIVDTVDQYLRLKSMVNKSWINVFKFNDQNTMIIDDRWVYKKSFLVFGWVLCWVLCCLINRYWSSMMHIDLYWFVLINIYLIWSSKINAFWFLNPSSDRHLLFTTGSHGDGMHEIIALTRALRTRVLRDANNNIHVWARRAHMTILARRVVKLFNFKGDREAEAIKVQSYLAVFCSKSLLFSFII